MHRISCSQPIAIGGLCLTAIVAIGTLAAPARAQQADESYPQWARPYLFSGFNTGPSFASASNQPAYTAKFDSGTVGLFVASNNGDDGAARAFSSAGNFFDPQSFSPATRQQNWSAASFGNPAWQSSIFGTYKSDPARLNGLYTTASFGAASFKTSPLGYTGLPGFTGNDAVGVTASAGVGLQLTPQISIEGSIGFTQMPSSALPIMPIR
jgi:hypothetical protein